MQRALTVGLALVCVCLLFAMSGPSAQRMITGDGSGSTSTPVPVAVNNFPAVQTVQGNVAVDKTVNVTGSVAVTNLPAVQQVEGTVSIANLPVAPSVVTFKGYTAATFPESYPGVLALSRACNSELPGSRLCGATEILGFIPPPNAPSTAGFLVSYPIAMTAVGSAEGVLQPRCMRADGVNFDCGDSEPTHPAACCGN